MPGMDGGGIGVRLTSAGEERTVVSFLPFAPFFFSSFSFVLGVDVGLGEALVVDEKLEAIMATLGAAIGVSFLTLADLEA